MWDLAVREEDYQSADSMMRRMAASPLSMRILLTFARGDSAARARILEEARASDSRQSQIAARYVATLLEDFKAAELLSQLDLARRRPPAIRVNAQLFLAWLELARGRWSAAQAAFARAERMEEAPPVLLQRALAATLPFLAVPPHDLDSLRSEVKLWNPRAAASDPDAGLAARLQPQLRLYLLGLLSSRLGDDTDALRLAAEIEGADGPEEARAQSRALGKTIRADVALQGGSVELADQALRAVQGEIPLELVSVPAYVNIREFTQEHARHLRVLVLNAQQKHTQALQWIENSFQGAPSEMVYLAPMHLQQAEIYERLGEREKAVEHYRRFVSLWRDCDPALRPVVDGAKAELARMTGEPRP
jgi:tetratricopeptide (TPR) repeat protein